MMNKEEREIALERMKAVSEAFYYNAIRIGVHPFIEFCGLMNEYIKACRSAHEKGIDFSECNKHAGNHLPLEDHEIRYLNEKLECIFTGRSIVQEKVYTLHVVEDQFSNADCDKLRPYNGQPVTFESIAALPVPVVITKVENNEIYVVHPHEY